MKKKKLIKNKWCSYEVEFDDNIITESLIKLFDIYPTL